MAVKRWSFSLRSGIKIRKLATCVAIIYLIIPTVSAQECTDIVGSLDYSRNELPVPTDRTSILTGYVVPCSGIVIAWEFCYQISGVPSVSVFPGIWKITETSDYVLVQSNNITYDPRGSAFNLFICKTFNLLNTEQFFVQAGWVVGLYSGDGQVKRTAENDLITTYQQRLNRTSISSSGSENVNYFIAIRVHLASTSENTIVSPTTSTSDTTTIISATSTFNSDIITITSITSIPLTVQTNDTATSVISSATTSDGPVSNNSGSNLDNIVIIGGAVGGVILLLLMIPVVLCVVVLCMRRCNGKVTHPDEEEHIYDTPYLFYDNSNANMHNTRRVIRDQQSHLRSINSLHGVDTENNVTESFDNRIYQSLDNDTTRKYNGFAYKENDLVSHNDMSTSSAINNYTVSESVDQIIRLPYATNRVHPSKEDKYGVINQIKCDCLDDETTSDSDSPAIDLSIDENGGNYLIKSDDQNM